MIATYEAMGALSDGTAFRYIVDLGHSASAASAVGPYRDGRLSCIEYTTACLARSVRDFPGSQPWEDEPEEIRAGFAAPHVVTAP